MAFYSSTQERTRSCFWPRERVGHKPRRRIAVCIVGLCLVTMTASCNGTEADPSPTPTESGTATPSPTEASWESKYDAKELEAYDAALARYNAYLGESEPIWATGKATPAAKKLFQKYYIPWQAYLKQLEQFDRSNIRIARNAEVLDSRATRIKLGSDGATVTIRQCVDATNIGATQNGEPLENAYATPQLAEVVLSEVKGRWYLTQLPIKPKDRPCVG